MPKSLDQHCPRDRKKGLKYTVNFINFIFCLEIGIRVFFIHSEAKREEEEAICQIKKKTFSLEYIMTR